MVDDFPLYVSVDQAVELSGISRRLWYDWLKSESPPPYIRVGNKHLIQRDGIASYLEQKQEVRL